LCGSTTDRQGPWSHQSSPREKKFAKNGEWMQGDQRRRDPFDDEQGSQVWRTVQITKKE
jgi:hypothetical protein